MTANSSGHSSLDPNLASILESIRATVTSDTLPAPQPTPPVTDIDPASTKPDSDDADAVTKPAPPPAPRTAPAETGQKRSIEEFLAELLRPQLEAWLSANLPEIVQKMAAEEIARLIGRD